MAWEILAGGIVIGVALLGIAFVCDELSEEEKRRQEQMRRDYDNYQEEKRREYQEQCHYYEQRRADERAQRAEELATYRREMMEKRKQKNRPLYDRFLSQLEQQREEKAKLLNECIDILQKCEKSIEEQQHSYVRIKSVKTVAVSLQESISKLKSYLLYLDAYKTHLKYIFDVSGELTEPFSMTLPSDYPYEGKVVYLKREDFYKRQTGFAYRTLFGKNASLGEKEYEWFDKHEILPFQFTCSKSGNWFLSLSKGFVKDSILNVASFRSWVQRAEHNWIQMGFPWDNYFKMFLNRKDLSNQFAKTPVGSTLCLFVKNYDFLLKKRVELSGRRGDSLSMERFSEIVMTQTQEERLQLHEQLKKQDLLDAEDEWRIGPVHDDHGNVAGLILQLGQYYGFQAFFEEILPDKLILRYHHVLPKEELINFDGIFVTTNVSLVCLTPGQVQNDPEKYEHEFQECRDLQLYLISEFAAQRRIATNSPMGSYLFKWGEVTKRLIVAATCGSRFHAEIMERDEPFGRGSRQYMLVTIKDNQTKKLRQFAEREKKRHRKRFFVEFPEEGGKRIPCKLLDEDNAFRILLEAKIDDEMLLRNQFQIDICSRDNAHAERQQEDALRAFREGRVASEALKAAILDVGSLRFLDNGQRIHDLFNQKFLENKAQLHALIGAFASEHLYLIQGPPGTGKTTVIKELILQQLRYNPKSRILVVSQANVAVDNVLRGIVQGYTRQTDSDTAFQIIRCGNRERIADDLEHFTFEEEFKRYKDSLAENLPQDLLARRLRERWISIVREQEDQDLIGEYFISCFQIIGATCVGLANQHYGLCGAIFDLVIIDEAGKALPGEIMIPLNRARKAVVIGDHKQLPPVVDPALYRGGEIRFDDVVAEDEQELFLNKSFFERLYEGCPESSRRMLNIQFRMPPVIANLVNKFYDGTLETGLNCLQKTPLCLDNHLIFIDMKDEPEYREQQHERSDGGKGSPYNLMEVKVACALVRKLRTGYKGRIVVITPYKRQKKELTDGFRQEGLQDVWADTIDAFQGDEADIIIYCTTRSQKTTKYFSDNARLNVAFSRSRNMLFFLGSSTYLEKYPKTHILHHVSEYLREYARMIPYKEWVRDDFILCFHASKSIQEENSGQAFNIQQLEEEIFRVEREKTAKKACAVCGNLLEEGEDTLCWKCLNGSEQITCSCCRGKIDFPYYDKYVLKAPPPTLCVDCEELTCCKCGSVFAIRKRDHMQYTFGRETVCARCQNTQIGYHGICRSCNGDIRLTYTELKRCRPTLPAVCRNCEAVRCDECGKTFYIRRDDWKEMRFKTDDDLKTVCPSCQRTKIAYLVECGNCFRDVTMTYQEMRRRQREHEAYPRYCKYCNEDVLIGTCVQCKKSITVPRFKYERPGARFNTELHPQCKNVIAYKGVCDDCGQTFYLKAGEKLYFLSKGSLPKRCEYCRKRRKLTQY